MQSMTPLHMNLLDVSMQMLAVMLVLRQEGLELVSVRGRGTACLSSR